MNDRVLVNVKSIAVGGRRMVLWPGVSRAGPAVPALFLGSFKRAQIPVTASVCLALSVSCLRHGLFLAGFHWLEL